METNNNKQKTSADYGNILPHHINAMKTVAQARDEIIILRPVNPKTAEYKESGVTVIDKNGKKVLRHVAAKGLGIKGKSASTGFIHVDQSTNKIGEYLKANPDLPKEEVEEKKREIEKLQKNVDEQIKKGNATVVTVRVGDKNVDVLADSGGRPYVADYDLLATGRNSLRQPNDILQEKCDLFGVVSRYDLSTIFDLNYQIFREDVKAGKISPRSVNFSPNTLEKKYSSAMIAHGADYLRPEGQGEKLVACAKEPLIAVTPDRKVFVFTDIDNFKSFLISSKKMGYELPINPDWQLGINEKEFEKEQNFLNSLRNNSSSTNIAEKTGEDLERIRWVYKRGLLNSEVNKISDPEKKDLANKILVMQDYATTGSMESFQKEADKLEKQYQDKYYGEPSPTGRERANDLLIEYLQARNSNNDELKFKKAIELSKNRHAINTFKLTRTKEEYYEIVKDVIVASGQKVDEKSIKKTEMQIRRRNYTKLPTDRLAAFKKKER